VLRDAPRTYRSQAQPAGKKMMYPLVLTSPSTVIAQSQGDVRVLEARQPARITAGGSSPARLANWSVRTRRRVLTAT